MKKNHLFIAIKFNDFILF